VGNESNEGFMILTVRLQPDLAEWTNALGEEENYFSFSVSFKVVSNLPMTFLGFSQISSFPGILRRYPQSPQLQVGCRLNLGRSQELNLRPFA
jgi:hypothetical protein